MVGVGLEEGLDAAATAARTCSSAAWSSTSPARDTLRLLPPLVIGEAEVDEALGIVVEALA